MSSPRNQLEVNVKKAEAYSQGSLAKAKEVLTTLTANIATMNERSAVVEVKKAYVELQAIKSDLDSQIQKLFAKLPVSLLSGRQIMRDISFNQKLIDQRLDALRWIVKGSDLADKLDQGKANLNEVNLKRDWDFERIKREDAGFSQLHHTRVPASEGGEILNELLSKVSRRVNESAEDAAMLMEVRKLNAKQEEEKKAQIKAAAEEVKAKEEAAKRDREEAAARRDKEEAARRDKEEAARRSKEEAARRESPEGIAADAIQRCVKSIEGALNEAGFDKNKKVGIFGQSALGKQADEISRLCSKAEKSAQQGFIEQALSELCQAVNQMNQPIKTFFGKKDPPYKEGVLEIIANLKYGLSQSEQYIKHFAETFDRLSVSQSQAKRMSRGTSAGG